MLFEHDRIAGVVAIDVEPHTDHRGFFARTRCEQEFRAQGLVARFVQDSIGYNKSVATLRGLHYHAAPFKQVRLVRCLSGALFMVVLDLRPGSKTYLGHSVFNLLGEDNRSIYISAGLAMGYQTECDNTTIFYQMPLFYDPAYERGLRWNDPAFSIDWPPAERTIAKRDAEYPDFDPASTEQFADYL